MGSFFHEIAGHAFVAFMVEGVWPSTPALRQITLSHSLTEVTGEERVRIKSRPNLLLERWRLNTSLRRQTL